MRLLYIALLALATLAPLQGAATATYDITAYPQVAIGGGFSLTSTEATITLTKGSVPAARIVQITCDQPWGIATATGAYATKQPLIANQSYTFVDSDDSRTFYVQASSATGTIRVSVLDSVER